jgi:hypothetical protein
VPRPDTRSFASSINHDEALSELELDTARFVLDGLIRRFSGTVSAWNAVVDLQSTELDHVVQQGLDILASHLRVFTFVRIVAVSLKLSDDDVRETSRVLLARDHGNVFGLFSSSPDEEAMAGFALYPTASYFNHRE